MTRVHTQRRLELARIREHLQALTGRPVTIHGSDHVVLAATRTWAGYPNVPKFQQGLRVGESLSEQLPWIRYPVFLVGSWSTVDGVPSFDTEIVVCERRLYLNGRRQFRATRDALTRAAMFGG